MSAILPQSPSRGRPLTSADRVRLRFQPNTAPAVKLNLTRACAAAKGNPAEIVHLIALIEAGARPTSEK